MYLFHGNTILIHDYKISIVFVSNKPVHFYISTHVQQRKAK